MKRAALHYEKLLSANIVLLAYFPAMNNLLVVK